MLATQLGEVNGWWVWVFPGSQEGTLLLLYLLRGRTSDVRNQNKTGTKAVELRSRAW